MKRITFLLVLFLASTFSMQTFAQWELMTSNNDFLAGRGATYVYGYTVKTGAYYLTNNGIYKRTGIDSQSLLANCGTDWANYVRYYDPIPGDATSAIYFIMPTKIISHSATSANTSAKVVVNSGTISLLSGGTMNTGDFTGIVNINSKLTISCASGLFTATSRNTTQGFAYDFDKLILNKNISAIHKLDETSLLYASGNVIFKYTATAPYTEFVQLPAGLNIHGFLKYNGKLYARASELTWDPDFLYSDFYEIGEGTATLYDQPTQGFQFIFHENKIYRVSSIDEYNNYYYYGVNAGTLNQPKAAIIRRTVSSTPQTMTWLEALSAANAATQANNPTPDESTTTNTTTTTTTGTTSLVKRFDADIAYQIGREKPTVLRVVDASITKEKTGSVITFANYDLTKPLTEKSIKIQIFLNADFAAGTYQLAPAGKCTALITRGKTQTALSTGKGSVTITSRSGGSFSMTSDGASVSGKFSGLSTR